jgi:hypothetical protein
VDGPGDPRKRRAACSGHRLARGLLRGTSSGAAVLRLNEKAATNPTLRPTAADLWVMMAESGRYLKALLAHNVVWNDGEKEWFSALKNDLDGISFVIDHVVPKLYRNDPRLTELAKTNNIWISPF